MNNFIRFSSVPTLFLLLQSYKLAFIFLVQPDSSNYSFSLLDTPFPRQSSSYFLVLWYECFRLLSILWRFLTHFDVIFLVLICFEAIKIFLSFLLFLWISFFFWFFMIFNSVFQANHLPFSHHSTLSSFKQRLFLMHMVS